MREKPVSLRFAPSPTGFLHVGNARTALINFLYCLKENGRFILRIDDTDRQRCSTSFLKSILEDLKWLGMDWCQVICQSSRLELYQETIQSLIKNGFLYPCYETPQELEQKRADLLKEGKPPIYDRASLELSESQIRQKEREGIQEHYRFKLPLEETSWNDLVRGQVKFKARTLSDPIVLREDGSATYLLSSVIDDIDCGITTILRGEDHLTNTAVQIQFFKALGSQAPSFGHLSLLRAAESKISKRVGGFSIKELKESIHPWVLRSFLALVGTSCDIKVCPSLEELASNFHLGLLSRAQTKYDQKRLITLNASFIRQLNYVELATVKQSIYPNLNEPYSSQTAQEMVNAKPTQVQPPYLQELSEEIWEKIRGNVEELSDISVWAKVMQEDPVNDQSLLDPAYLGTAARLLPKELSKASVSFWIQALEECTKRKGAELYMPIRLALTGRKEGPELHLLLSLLGYETALKRLEKPKLYSPEPSGKALQ